MYGLNESRINAGTLKKENNEESILSMNACCSVVFLFPVVGLPPTTFTL